MMDMVVIVLVVGRVRVRVVRVMVVLGWLSL
jgi:hypothetical protein